MIKRAMIILLLSYSFVQAQEIITGTDDSNIVILNEELRKYRQDIKALTNTEKVEVANATAGDIIYRDNTTWRRLPKGTENQTLQQGPYFPQWGTPAVHGNMNYTDARFKVGDVPYAVTDSGNVAVTGVGFTPKFVTFTWAGADGLGWGQDDGSSRGVIGMPNIWSGNPGTQSYSYVYTTGYSIYLYCTAEAYPHSASTHTAYVSAFNSNGFNLTWSGSGCPVPQMQYTAYR